MSQKITLESLVLGDFNSSVEVTPFVELENCCDFAVESIDFFNSCTTESTYESAANVASMMNMESSTITLEADAGEQKVSHLKKFIEWVKSMFKAFLDAMKKLWKKITGLFKGKSVEKVVEEAKSEITAELPKMEKEEADKLSESATKTTAISDAMTEMLNTCREELKGFAYTKHTIEESKANVDKALKSLEDIMKRFDDTSSKTPEPVSVNQIVTASKAVSIVEKNQSDIKSMETQTINTLNALQKELSIVVQKRSVLALNSPEKDALDVEYEVITQKISGLQKMLTHIRGMLGKCMSACSNYSYRVRSFIAKVKRELTTPDNAAVVYL